MDASNRVLVLFILMILTSSITICSINVNAEFTFSDNTPAVEWQKFYGDSDQIPKITQTSDGGYVFIGLGWSHQMSQEPTGLYKIDSFGNLSWSKEINANDLAQTYDGGYTLLQPIGNGAALVKFDSNDRIQWNRTYQNFPEVFFRCLTATNDGGYVIAANNASGTIYINFGRADVQQFTSSLIKTDSSGKIQWMKSFNINGTNEIFAFEILSMIQTSDGGYALGGTATMNTQDTNFCLIKVSVDGNLEWVKTYGGEKDDEFSSFTQTTDGGFVLSGRTYSFNGAPNYVFVPSDPTLPTVVNRDTGDSQAWLVRTDSFGSIIWNYTYGVNTYETDIYGTNDYAYASSVIQTSDGQLAFAGSHLRVYLEKGQQYAMVGGSVIWLVKLDLLGNVIWSQNYHQSSEDKTDGTSALIETNDGSFLIAGHSGYMYSPWLSSYLLIKTEPVLPPPTPLPTLLLTPTPSFEIPLIVTVAIITVIALAIVVSGLLVYFKKHKR